MYPTKVPFTYSLIALKSGCELGDFPREIVFHVMEALGWAGSVSLSLTCTEMYDIFKRIYPPKIRLRTWVDTTTFSPYSTKPTRIRLHNLIENWDGLRGYTFWAGSYPWNKHRVSPENDRWAVSRFLRQSVYGDVSEDTSKASPEASLRERLLENYQDCTFSKIPHSFQRLIDRKYPRWPGSPTPWQRNGSAERPFRGMTLPSPYNMGVEGWEREAKKVIVDSMGKAYDWKHLAWYWRNFYLWRRNKASFREIWDLRQAEIALDIFSEWGVLVDS